MKNLILLLPITLSFTSSIFNFAFAQSNPTAKFVCSDGSMPSMKTKIEYPALPDLPAFQVEIIHCDDLNIFSPINSNAVILEIPDFTRDVRLSVNDRVIEFSSRLGVLPPDYSGRIDLLHGHIAGRRILKLTSPVRTEVLATVRSHGCAGNFQIFNEPPPIEGVDVKGRDIAYVDLKSLAACAQQVRQRPFLEKDLGEMLLKSSNTSTTRGL